MTKTLIIYFSYHHQNTLRVAEHISKAVKGDLLSVVKANPSILKKYDLLGFGSGIYYGKHHKLLLDFVRMLPEQRKKAFIFSTSGIGLPNLGHSALRKELVKKGFKIVGEFSCRGHDSVGFLKYIGGINKNRPNRKDLKKARDFAKKLV